MVNFIRTKPWTICPEPGVDGGSNVSVVHSAVYVIPEANGEDFILNPQGRGRLLLQQLSMGIFV